MEKGWKLIQKTPQRYYVKNNYIYFIGDTDLNLKEIASFYYANGTPKRVRGNDTKFVLLAEWENCKRVTLRTKGRHGPTIEFNMKFRTKKSRGVIKKYRIKGKLISKQLRFSEFFRLNQMAPI